MQDLSEPGGWRRFANSAKRAGGVVLVTGDEGGKGQLGFLRREEDVSGVGRERTDEFPVLGSLGYRAFGTPFLHELTAAVVGWGELFF